MNFSEWLRAHGWRVERIDGREGSPFGEWVKADEVRHDAIRAGFKAEVVTVGIGNDVQHLVTEVII